MKTNNKIKKTNTSFEEVEKGMFETFTFLVCMSVTILISILIVIAGCILSKSILETPTFEVAIISFMIIAIGIITALSHGTVKLSRIIANKFEKVWIAKGEMAKEKMERIKGIFKDISLG